MIDFGYGLKKSETVEQETRKSIEIIPHIEVHSRNAFGTFLKIGFNKAEINFHSSTLGVEGRAFYKINLLTEFARKSFKHHFRRLEPGKATLLVNHLMIQEDNNQARDEIVRELSRLGKEINCAVPSGETAVMNTLEGIYLGLTSISFAEGDEIKLNNKVIMPHADGVGTKSQVYEEGNYGFVQDAVAMNLNDILIAGLSVPEKTFICNTLILGSDCEEHGYLIKEELKRICKEKKLDLMTNNHVYMNNFQGAELDMVMTSVFNEQELPKTILQERDHIIGVGSNGIHSNGLTGARSYAEKLTEKERKDFYKELAKPTPIYDDLFNALEDVKLKAGVNITGGAFTKILKILPDDLSAYIHRNHSLKPQDLFYELYTDDKRMYNYFNCGVGLILVTNNKTASQAVDKIKKTGYKADVIGELKKGNKEVIIESMFGNETIKYH